MSSDTRPQQEAWAVEFADAKMQEHGTSPAIGPPLVKLKNLHKRFGQLVVLDGVDLTVNAGETLVVLGASGSGKSVMLKHIVGLLRPDRGEVFFDNVRIDQLDERDLSDIRHRFGYLFQQGALFDSLTNLQNVGFPVRQHTRKTPEEVDAIAQRMLTLVGLPQVGHKMPSEVSGGQRKRVALARAIAMEPDIVFYDEPTTGLDPIRSDVISELILKLQRELKVTSIVVTHDMANAFKVGDRIVMLHKGKIIFDGTAEDIRCCADDRVQRFVKGEADEEELSGLR
ncbi:MAG: ABC transporter ATP-binding protein [Planctomycetota bacterium]